jgi:hypothetical protein
VLVTGVSRLSKLNGLVNTRKSGGSRNHNFGVNNQTSRKIHSAFDILSRKLAVSYRINSFTLVCQKAPNCRSCVEFGVFVTPVGRLKNQKSRFFSTIWYQACSSFIMRANLRFLYGMAYAKQGMCNILASSTLLRGELGKTSSSVERITL